ncbi:LysR family transcriptional regulator [Frankia sp. AgB1.8]|uniref:LysR family transcriptional regulator n=1 Tax=Frankia sp. AgB1.8 TaxID=2792839 RepID=UPI0027DB6A34|nr:LysR family transcriptional regulator [Frankia sp. AgB1.8]
MDLVLLRTFTAVARSGSFSAAARELGYTQSAVSQQIAALEASLGGASLLTRRPVATTAAGARLLEHAEPLLLRASAARADVLRAAGGPPDQLRVAACPLALPRLAAAFGAAMDSMPRLDVTITVAALDAVAIDVARGACELGLAVGLATPGDPLRLPDVGPLRAVEIAVDPVSVILPADHPFARRPGLRLADLADARWRDAPAAAAPAADVRRAVGAERLPHCAVYAGTDLAGLAALVAAGAGLVLLPAWAVAGRADVAAVPVAEPRLEYRVEVLAGVTADTGAAGRVLATLLGA